MAGTPSRPRSTLVLVLAGWLLFYGSCTLFTPPLLDDADSVHAEVAREMLLRHDFVTLYANGIRYLEKAPLLYWSMAASMRVSQLAGASSPRALAAAARVPLAVTMLALALLCESFARRLGRTVHAGLYAALITLSSFGLFIYGHLTLPDSMVCLWFTFALYACWRTEESDANPRRWTFLFAAACALNVLTKGLIGVVFPVGTVAMYLVLTRGARGALRRAGELRPWWATLLFLGIAAPWHIAAGLANPTQGHPLPFHFSGGHWQVPVPTSGNVRGWFWFYFMNEHVLRYLNLRVPRDYDTVPLWLFWGLCLVWLMPWSAFGFRVARWAAPAGSETWRNRLRQSTLNAGSRGKLLLTLAAAFVLLFFSLSTRQEYYVLPALPAAAILIGSYLAQLDSAPAGSAPRRSVSGEAPSARSGRRTLLAIAASGTCLAAVALFFLISTQRPSAGTQLNSLLVQNPGEYALSMGHFLDLKTRALGMFHPSLALVVLACGILPWIAYGLRRHAHLHGSTYTLMAATFLFVWAADLALITFAPTLSSAQLADAIAPDVKPQDLVVIHGEYEAGSTMGFYLQRANLHILEGRSSNLWYGSFFPDAPPIFETRDTLGAKWAGPQRVFLWEDTQDAERKPFVPAGPVYVLASSEGKRILSNQPAR